MEKVRIQKVLAAAGVASRRAVEQMVLDGRVTVNGEVISALPCFVTEADEIRLDGQTIRNRPEKKVYILLNKPRGVICTQRDETGRNRPRAIDVVGWAGLRVYCVGRLDADSTGLIILTNDGELTNRLTHPRYGVVKTYIARVEGRVTAEELASLRSGIFLGPQKSPDGRAKRKSPKSPAKASVRVIRRGPKESLLELRVSEGRNRQVRRMLARVGHKVFRLHRSSIGPIPDRGLKIGRFRRLDTSEVSALRKVAGI